FGASFAISAIVSSVRTWLWQSMVRMRCPSLSPPLIPEQAGSQGQAYGLRHWVPAFAGTSGTIHPTSSGAQRRHAELRGDLVELRDQVARHRHAVLDAVFAARAAFVAGEPHGVKTGQRLRGAQVAQVAVHFGFELRCRREARDVERDDE